jgi:hypothetical protein
MVFAVALVWFACRLVSALAERQGRGIVFVVAIGCCCCLEVDNDNVPRWPHIRGVITLTDLFCPFWNGAIEQILNLVYYCLFIAMVTF